MPLKLCEKCGQYMKQEIGVEKIEYHCTNCPFKIDASDEDTLLDSYKKSSETTNTLVLQSFLFDTTVTCVPYACPKCDLPFQKMCHVGENMQIVIQCPRCSDLAKIATAAEKAAINASKHAPARNKTTTTTRATATTASPVRETSTAETLTTETVRPTQVNTTGKQKTNAT